jgi:hypothetical protein
MYTGRRVITPYQGKVVHLFVDLLEVPDVVVRQNRIIHHICGMTFWYLRPVTSRSPGLLEVPAASSEDGCWAPASEDAVRT